MTFNEFHEKGNVDLHKLKPKYLRLFMIINLFVSVTALITLSIYYGFPHTTQSDSNMMTIMRCENHIRSVRS